MTEFFSNLAVYYSHSFVWYATVVGILIALCSSLFGVTLVLKRFSFISDGLSHVAFGALAIASILKVTNSILVVMPVTIICAVILLRTGSHTKIKGDAAIALISVSSLALGYLFLNAFSATTNLAGDVCSTLFGSVSLLTLSDLDMYVCIGLSVLVIVLFIIFYNKLFAVTFDEDFSCATGLRTGAYNLFVAIIIAVIIVIAMNLVGSLLVSALVIFPALSAMRVFKSFRAVTICSSVTSVFCALVGIIASISFETPVGAAIVAVNLVVFLLFCAADILLRKRV